MKYNMKKITIKCRTGYNLTKSGFLDRPEYSSISDVIVLLPKKDIFDFNYKCDVIRIHVLLKLLISNKA